MMHQSIEGGWCFCHSASVVGSCYTIPGTTFSYYISFSTTSRATGNRTVISTNPPERMKAETGGADQWVLKRRELPGFVIVDEKKRPLPWDTHYQFSIKTLLSN